MGLWFYAMFIQIDLDRACGVFTEITQNVKSRYLLLFLLTKSFVYKKELVKICQVTKLFVFEVFTNDVFFNKIA